MAEKNSTVVAWGDPNLIYSAHQRMKSIDLFRAIKDGKLPLEPSMSLVGAELTGVKPGVVKISLVPDKRHYDQSGAVQTSILLALTDTAAGYAIHTRVPLGVRCATLELQVSLMKPVTTAAGRISVVGRAIRIGARTATAEAKVLDSAGELYSSMTTTFIVLPPDLG